MSPTTSPSATEFGQKDVLASNLDLLRSRPGLQKFPQSRRFWAAVFAAIAGGAIMVVLLGSGQHPSGAAASVPPSNGGVAHAVAPAAVVENPAVVRERARAALLGEATAFLEKELAEGPYRVQLLAAMALLRTNHAGAKAHLVAALATDESEIRRLEIARALAGVGEARGFEVLAAALESRRRDVRLEAARGLARLGDARGEQQLLGAMDIRTQRLSAAESLAELGVEKGRKALLEALGDTSREMRLRAAVALGRLGDAAGREILDSMATEPVIEVAAASALARLGSARAPAALVRALGLTAVRVDAAFSVRRAGLEVEHAPLATALSHGDELSRITAAESLIILLSPSLVLPLELPVAHAATPARRESPAPRARPANARPAERPSDVAPAEVLDVSPAVEAQEFVPG